MKPRIQLASANLQHLFVKALIRSCEIEFFPWSCVNFLHNLSYLLLTDVRKASILWNALPNEPIYILNSPAASPLQGNLLGDRVKSHQS